MRPATALSAALALLAATCAGAAPPASETIAQILVRPQGWWVYIETTPQRQPSERATKAGYQFFRRGAEVVGRTTAMAEGFNCEFKVRVREGGVDLHPRSRACNDRYTDDAPYTSFDHDPADPKYPFKRLNVPQKWWLSPQR